MDAKYNRPWRRPLLFLLAIFVIIGISIGWGVAKTSWQPTPKLALDLEGGTQVILNAQTPDGSEVTKEQLDRAIAIMGQRVNALGVAETEITAQGGNNIVVDVPGALDKATADALKRTALMQFRPLLIAAPGASLHGTAVDEAARQAEQGIKQLTTEQGKNNPAADANSQLAKEVAEEASPKWLTEDVLKQFYALDCTDPEVRNQERKDDAKSALVTCSVDGQEKYVLGPVTVQGANIKDASASNETTPTGQVLPSYQVNLTFDKEGAEKFGAATLFLFKKEGLSDRFAIVLDSLVISAPSVRNPITNGTAAITGSFTRDGAETLAQQLKFGALPLKFTVQSEQQISATLGADQLRSGLLAGLIGLLIVVVYSIFQYRALAIVTSSSLVVAGLLTYGVITIMSNLPDVGFRLSLAGVAGLIVAIGFTADSFIVYFERVRDEIRDGRTLVQAVEKGWERARRTILASDTVNVIAAVVLYLLSVGGVRGFAFTLGLTTLIDLIVVFFFTHPMLQWLSRTRFFGSGHPLSGMDPRQLGVKLPAYAGRGRVRSLQERNGNGAGETIAERKARLAAEKEAGE